MRIRPLSTDDLEVVHRLNEAEVPRVGSLRDISALTGLLEHCDLAIVAEDPDDRTDPLLGFLLAIAPGTSYGSMNYRFFEDRGTDHLYVDRVAVAPHARRRGIGGRLYDVLEGHARGTGRTELTCEVNVRPRNQPSLDFHAARGFVEVAQQDTSRHVTVSLLAKLLR